MNGEGRARWLVFGIGNPSRGDDALGSLFIERLEEWAATAEELPVTLSTLTDFQCQVENALDLIDIDVVVFVDASVSAASPYELSRLQPEFDVTYTTHALSPACVLAVAAQLGQTLPEAWTLAIPGQSFELGTPLSPGGEANLGSAFAHLSTCLCRGELRGFPLPAGGA